MLLEDAAQAQAFKWGARSETGYVRHENHDRMIRVSTSFGDVFIVSDGMGGHKGGAVAAEMTVKTLESKMVEAGANDKIVDAVRKAFEAANSAVYEKAHSGDSETEGMGATALMLVTAESSALVAHVGDSRAYLFRDGRLQRLTNDHTRVQRMVDAGMLTAKEAEDHPDAGLLERAMGNKPDIEVEIAPWLKLNSGDQLLLCSDGLCGYVEDTEIEATMAKTSAPQDLVDDLVNLSLAKGGNDNVTVQIIRYGDQLDYERKPEREDVQPRYQALTQRRQARSRTVFISYRREGEGAFLARSLRAELRHRGCSVFLDVDSLGTGHFDDALLREIENAQNFIVIMSAGSLDRCNDDQDWFRKEMAHAISTNRNFIPVLMDNFQWPNSECLPKEIQPARRHHGLRYTHDYFDAMMAWRARIRSMHCPKNSWQR